MRLAASRGPVATPLCQPSPSRSGSGSPKSRALKRSRLQAGSAARVVSRGPWMAPPRPRASRSHNREVTSENPSNQALWSGRSCSSSRAAPQPPRTQANNAAPAWLLVSPGLRSAARWWSAPARNPQRRPTSSGRSSTSSPQLRSTSMPNCSRSPVSRAELAATRRTRSPDRSGLGWLRGAAMVSGRRGDHCGTISASSIKAPSMT